MIKQSRTITRWASGLARLENEELGSHWGDDVIASRAPFILCLLAAAAATSVPQHGRAMTRAALSERFVRALISVLNAKEPAAKVISVEGTWCVCRIAELFL
jgi:hypothetical protein